MKLNKRMNGKKTGCNYSISISLNEARQLNWVDENGNTKELQKNIVDGKLIIEEA